MITKPRHSVEQDGLLVDRCAAGDPAAWEVLYNQCHDGLIAAIRLMYGRLLSDQNQIEEIAARVWYKLISDGGKLLRQFDTQRDCRLVTYLAVIAKSEAGIMFRSDRRRRDREKYASVPNTSRSDYLQEWTDLELREFLAGLTPREQEFLSLFLLASPEEGDEFSDTNRWQLSSRIQRKLREFLDQS